MPQRRIPDESGGGGGKVRRRPMMKWDNNTAGTGLCEWQASPQTTPTQNLGNSGRVATVRPQYAWTYASAAASTLTLSIPSTYWVDVIGMVAEAHTSQLTINGNRLDPVAPGYFQVQYFDVYGYGVSVTAQFTASYENKMAPVAVQTYISTGGSVVFPPGLSGRQVARDI